MITNWPQMRAFLLKWETLAVTNDPRDPGKQTAGGISRRYHPNAAVWALVDRGITSGALYEQAIHEFYDDKYQALFERLPARVNAAYIDALVNMGDGKTGDESLGAVELLQLALNRLAGSDYVDVDGDLGPQTRAAIKTVDAAALAFTFCAFRQAEYNRRARSNKSKQVWLGGWLNRVSDLMRII